MVWKIQPNILSFWHHKKHFWSKNYYKSENFQANFLNSLKILLYLWKCNVLDQADVGTQVNPSAVVLTPRLINDPNKYKYYYSKSHTMASMKEAHSDCAPIPPDVKEVLEKGDQQSPVEYPD